MSDRLPPLTALRAFDAAARHMSFAKAADELAVTPAALSFQIKSLEDHLGQQVFRRLNRAVELTEAGRTLAPGVHDGFEHLNAAWRAAQRLQDGRPLTVTAGPAFTAKFLAPRLFAFAQAHPDIELRFAATLRALEFDRDDVDIAIRFGTGGPVPGLFSELLLPEVAVPVMVPRLASQYTTPESLMAAPLVFDDSVSFLKPEPNWSNWFKAVGVDYAPTHGPRFSQADHAIDAALVGAGVLLGRGSLVAKYVRDGTLVAPFHTILSTKAHFRFLCPNGAETRPQVARFRAWLKAEVTKFQDTFDGKRVIAVESLSP